jgi:hypothetical protein
MGLPPLAFKKQVPKQHDSNLVYQNFIQIERLINHSTS